ncbi:hypothetical protein LTR81_024312 [Elasticomyces elasticus]
MNSAGSWITLTLPSGSLSTGLQTVTNGSSTLTLESILTPIGVAPQIQTLTIPDESTVNLRTIVESQTTLINGSTLTAGPLPTNPLSTSGLDVETFTRPVESTGTSDLLSGTSITGIETLMTVGSTLAVGPGATPSTTFTSNPVTSTMTTLPPGLSIELFTDISLTANSWLTTTGVSHSTTIVPIILPCATCQPDIVRNSPGILNVDFNWSSLPQLSTYHLPCIKIFEIVIAGSCLSLSGTAPANDNPPVSPEPTRSPSYTTPHPSSPDESCTTSITGTDLFYDNDIDLRSIFAYNEWGDSTDYPPYVNTILAELDSTYFRTLYSLDSSYQLNYKLCYSFDFTLPPIVTVRPSDVVYGNQHTGRKLLRVYSHSDRLRFGSGTESISVCHIISLCIL